MNRIPGCSILLYLIVISILLIGWTMLYSAASGNANDWANKQLFSGITILCISIVVGVLSTRYIFKFSYYFLMLCILLLIAAEVMGHTAMGAQRWLKIGVITIQPSEITKIGVILALSRFFSQLTLQQISQIKNLIIPIFIVLLPAGIILRQPNLGTTMIIILISSTLFFAAGVRIRVFAIAIAAVLISLPIIWTHMHDYQKKRVMTFLEPEKDLLGDGYNIMQSKIAIGSGGIYGKGFLNGSQVQLSFLPEKHTDFIFTILAEEFGFYGVIFMLCLYAFLIYLIYLIALRTKQQYSKLICIGVASMIFFHVFINIGMISGILPVVGTPLPLLSYGRSNLITTIICIGLVFNADLYRNQSRVLK